MPKKEAEPATRPGPRTETREVLLKVARAEFAREGFSGTRVDEIAEKAGVNKQAIYHHFGSKDDLFQATLEAGYEQVLRTNLAYVAGRLPQEPVKALKHLIEHVFDRFHLHPEMVQLVLEENRQKGRHLRNRAQVEQANRPMVARMTEVIGMGQRAGVFAPGLDAKQVFFDMVSLCMFYFANVYTMSAALEEDFVSAAWIRRRRTHIVKHMLRAVAAGD